MSQNGHRFNFPAPSVQHGRVLDTICPAQWSGGSAGCDPHHVQPLHFIVRLIGDGCPDMRQHTCTRTPMQLRVREGQFVNIDQFVRIMKSELRRVAK